MSDIHPIMKGRKKIIKTEGIQGRRKTQREKETETRRRERDGRKRREGKI